MTEQADASQQSKVNTGLKSIMSGKVVAVASVVTLPFDITEKVFGATSGLLALSAIVFVVLLLMRRRLFDVAPEAKGSINAAFGVFGLLTLLSGGCYFYNSAVGPAEAKGVLLDTVPGLEEALDPILASLSRIEETTSDIQNTTRDIDQKTNEILREANPAKYAEKVAVKEPLNYFEVFKQGIGTEASGQKQWALRIGPGERFEYGSLSVVLAGDFNNDGYVDALIHYWDGGNTSDGYIEGFLLHKGGPQFRYVPIVLEEVNPIQKAKIVESASPFAQFEMATINGGIVKIHIEGDAVQVTQQAEKAKAFGLATLYSSEVYEDRNPLHGSGNPDAMGHLKFDYNRDGNEDEMVCGFWERWHVLQGCSVVLQGTVIQVGAGSPHDLQCKSIVVSDAVQNGFHNLVCEYNDIRKEYRYDPSSALYVHAAED